jgi:GxxExxY protein
MNSPSLSAEFLNSQTSAIIGAAIEIHRALGPGLLESAYLPCLVYELRHAGLLVETEVRLPLIYKNVRVNTAFVADAIVSRAVLVEVKAMEAIAPIHERQLSTYLRLGDFRVGLLLNFGAPTMIEGIHRSANNFPDA